MMKPWEFVIVCGIIVVLAAIVVPNMTEFGRGGSQISSWKSDARSMTMALAAYHAEHGDFPPLVPATLSDQGLKKLAGAGLRFPRCTPALTTPIAYISSFFPDVQFSNIAGEFVPMQMAFRGRHMLQFTTGRDDRLDYDPLRDILSAEDPQEAVRRFSYDPTNGTRSSGDLFRFETFPEDLETSGGK